MIRAVELACRAAALVRCERSFVEATTSATVVLPFENAILDAGQGRWWRRPTHSKNPAAFVQVAHHAEDGTEHVDEPLFQRTR